MGLGRAGANQIEGLGIDGGGNFPVFEDKFRTGREVERKLAAFRSEPEALLTAVGMELGGDRSAVFKKIVVNPAKAAPVHAGGRTGHDPALKGGADRDDGIARFEGDETGVVLF